MIAVTDQMGFKVQVPSFPKRIISLVPSQTELLYDLGLEERVVGITRFCVHPKDWFRTKPKIGGTKDFSPERIRKLNPDLIIGNKEENHREGIINLKEDYPVWMSDISDLGEALDMIKRVSELVNEKEKGIEMAKEIQSSLNSVDPLLPPKKVAYAIWKDPWMFAGKGTFIDHMMERVGLNNIFDEGWPRYPQLPMEEVRSMDPDILMLSSEPFPFKEKHKQQLSKEYPHVTTVLVDGEMFSWYGSRLKKAGSYLSDLVSSIG